MFRSSDTSRLIEQASAAAPLQIAFDRVSLLAGGTASVVFNLTEADLRLTDRVGGQSLYPGDHGLEVWLGHGAPAELTLKVVVVEVPALL